MRDLVVIGASGFGKEVCWLASRANIPIKGFLDDTPEKQGKMISGISILGEISDYRKYLDCDFVVAIGSSHARKSIVERLQDEVTFVQLIDPNAIIDPDMVGIGGIICAGVIATVDVKIGNHTIINLNSTIGHDSVLGNFVTVAPNVSISGNTEIEDLVEVGTGAAILQKTRLGYGSVLGMGSILAKDLESNKVAVGNPARVIKSII